MVKGVAVATMRMKSSSCSTEHISEYRVLSEHFEWMVLSEHLIEWRVLFW